MRLPVILLVTVMAFQLVGCGSSRKLEQTFSSEQALSASNDAGVNTKITHYKQTDRYLIVDATITNNSQQTLTVKNGDGSALPSFRAMINGQSFMADRRGMGGTWNPWTGYSPRQGSSAGDLELPAGISASIQLRWDFQLGEKDYNWSVVFTNLVVGDKKSDDIRISYPPAGAAPAGK